MAHKDWCGKPCSDCENPCPLDASFPCSPDCPNLREDGTIDAYKCKGCDCVEILETEG